MSVASPSAVTTDRTALMRQAFRLILRPGAARIGPIRHESRSDPQVRSVTGRSLLIAIIGIDFINCRFRVSVAVAVHAAQNSNHILDATHEQISIYNGADRAETQSAGLPGACDSGREHPRCYHHVLAPGRASPRIAIRCAGAKFRDRESNRRIGSRQRREIARPHTGSASQ
jgi:hypothetical protein